jgi:hypothetical protein
MMSDIFLNLLSKVGQLARGHDQPFGGVQVSRASPDRFSLELLADFPFCIL